MILAVDVHYTGHTAKAAGVSFRAWEQPSFDTKFISPVSPVEDYTPGSFYKRELPCILKLLHDHKLAPDCIVIDGFVFLDGASSPGLGKHLYDSLNASTPVVGVAKTAFKKMSEEYQIFRGASRKPLYITAAGMPLEQARRNIRSMHGRHRIPEMLKSTDQLCRGIRGPK
jgi:deoxyribonuclease V